jgi:hypothetical protein
LQNYGNSFGRGESFIGEEEMIPFSFHDFPSPSFTSSFSLLFPQENVVSTSGNTTNRMSSPKHQQRQPQFSADISVSEYGADSASVQLSELMARAVSEDERKFSDQRGWQIFREKILDCVSEFICMKPEDYTPEHIAMLSARVQQLHLPESCEENRAGGWEKKKGGK